jgi:hypothetical protein
VTGFQKLRLGLPILTESSRMHPIMRTPLAIGN